MITLGIIVIVMTVVVLSIDRPHNSFASEAKTLDVTVNLSNTGYNIGTYEIHVTAYGEETLEQSKLIDTSTQTCPEDIESLCYVKAGSFSFPSQSVPVGSKIHVCVREYLSGVENCADGNNTEKNTPEFITVAVPPIK